MDKIKIIVFVFTIVVITYFISFSFITFQFEKEINQCFDNIEEITNTKKHKLLTKVSLDANNNLFIQIDNLSDCFTVKSIKYEVIGLRQSKIDTIQFSFYDDVLPSQTLKTVINEIKLDSIINFKYDLKQIKL
jgi:hypothetical protein|tara:strand:- start:220 stop:618 length:399 start_codon:yes stop_codon:yes gene_type:complete